MNRPGPARIFTSVDVLKYMQAEVLGPSLELDALGNVDVHVFCGRFRLGIRLNKIKLARGPTEDEGKNQA
jgi:hypothetical protein